MNKIKQFIVNLSWFKPQIEELLQQERIKVFGAAQKDVLETMRDDLDKKAEELAQEKLSKLLSPVDLNKIVTLDKQKGIVFIGGERVDDGRLANLKAEAEALEGFDLWQLISETPKELAQRAMFVDGDNLDAMKKGRSILYTLASQRSIMDVLKSYQKK